MKKKAVTLLIIEWGRKATILGLPTAAKLKGRDCPELPKDGAESDWGGCKCVEGPRSRNRRSSPRDRPFGSTRFIQQMTRRRG